MDQVVLSRTGDTVSLCEVSCVVGAQGISWAGPPPTNCGILGISRDPKVFGRILAARLGRVQGEHGVFVQGFTCCLGLT